jgi:hypothetical protein
MRMGILSILQILLVFVVVGCSRLSPASPTATAPPTALITPTSRELPTPEPRITPSPTPTTQVDSAGRPDRIVVSGVSVRYRDAIVVKGGSTLPDGSCILTQLSQVDLLVDWWPSQTCGEVQNGGWLLVVELMGEDGPLELSEELEYAVTAWSEDDPAIESEPFYFDLQPPPTPDE